MAAVFAQAPGALQLLPSESYGSNWLEICSSSGIKLASLPVSDPYEEIYLQRDKWWGLINEEWLRPKDGMRIQWKEFSKNVRRAKDFHRSIAGVYHSNTFVFYGGGTGTESFTKVQWVVSKGSLPASSKVDFLSLTHQDIRTDGFNKLYVGGQSTIKTVGRGDSPVPMPVETSDWVIKCGPPDSAGDGTVPAGSGRAPRQTNSRNILQQFELPAIKHEPAYRDYPVCQIVTYYAITKLAALADLS